MHDNSSDSSKKTVKINEQSYLVEEVDENQPTPKKSHGGRNEVYNSHIPNVPKTIDLRFKKSLDPQPDQTMAEFIMGSKSEIIKDKRSTMMMPSIQEQSFEDSHMANEEENMEMTEESIKNADYSGTSNKVSDFNFNTESMQMT